MGFDGGRQGLQCLFSLNNLISSYGVGFGSMMGVWRGKKYLVSWGIGEMAGRKALDGFLFERKTTEGENSSIVIRNSMEACGSLSVPLGLSTR